jgi:hypothetical protein
VRLVAFELRYIRYNSPIFSKLFTKGEV